jgi:hypothetical protein
MFVLIGVLVIVVAAIAMSAVHRFIDSLLSQAHGSERDIWCEIHACAHAMRSPPRHDRPAEVFGVIHIERGDFT